MEVDRGPQQEVADEREHGGARDQADSSERQEYAALGCAHAGGLALVGEAAADGVVRLVGADREQRDAGSADDLAAARPAEHAGGGLARRARAAAGASGDHVDRDGEEGEVGETSAEVRGAVPEVGAAAASLRAAADHRLPELPQGIGEQAAADDAQRDLPKRGASDQRERTLLVRRGRGAGADGERERDTADQPVGERAYEEPGSHEPAERAGAVEREPLGPRPGGVAG